MDTAYQSVLSAADYIEAHLRDDLALEEVAARAALYSPFHFIRLFRLLAGETPGGYLRKRRLSEAARDLAESNRSVLQIALAYRFRSAEAFARSFKHQFGLSPSQHCREKGFLHLVDRLRAEQIGAPGQPAPEPAFAQLGPLHFAGLQRRAGSGDLAALWAELGPILPRITRRAGPPLLCGVWEYPRRFQASRDPDYTAAARVEGPAPQPTGLRQFSLPPNRYAVFTHTGPLRLIRHTYVAIYAEWLPNSDWVQSDPYDLEIYTERFRGPADETSQLDIAVPVRPR
jgi:AraC family transcriptional regulator